MARASEMDVKQRPEEITRACRRLYESMTFQQITLLDISRETSLSRPSIYNYFQSKEEIFLAILGEEYAAWESALAQFAKKAGGLSKDEFVSGLAHTLDGRETLLKIQCMNVYEIEEHSRIERLAQFKTEYGRCMERIRDCLSAAFPAMTGEEKEKFLLAFLPFLYGVYPFAVPTERQAKAMKMAGIGWQGAPVYALTYACIRQLLG